MTRGRRILVETQGPGRAVSEARVRARRGPGAIRAVIAGAGLMGRWHAEASVKAGGRIVAIVDRASDRAQRLAGRHPGSRVFLSLESALGSIDADAIHVCTPIEAHAPAAEAAINASLHALVEKPLVATAAETERLVRLAAQAGVFICPVHQFLFQDGVRRARRWLEAIGEIVHIEATFCSAGGEGRATDRLDEIAAEILPHPLALVQHFAPAMLGRGAWDSQRPAPGELRIATEAGAATASILVSLRARPTVCAMSILGDAGAIHLDLFHGYGVLEPGDVSRARKILHPFALSARRLAAASANIAGRVLRWEPAYPGLRALVRALYAAIREGAPPPIPAADTIAVARARDAIVARTRASGEREDDHARPWNRAAR